MPSSQDHSEPCGAGSLGSACRKSGHIGRFFDTHSVDQAIIGLAKAQHGVFAAAQLRGLGLTVNATRKRAASGRLHRIYQGVYALVPATLLTANGRLMAAVLACGPGAALSLQTAARLHGLLGHAPTKPHVTVPTTAGRSRPRIQVHRSATLGRRDVVAIYGIPTTTCARTIFDLAAVLPARALERLLDQALHLDLLDINALGDQVARNRGRHRNRVRLERVLATHRVGSTLTENGFEEAFLTIVDAAGLPRPEAQAHLDLGDGEPMIRADFLWREQRLIVETDGFGTHGRRLAFERDRRRDQRCTAAGYRTMRVTRRQVRAEPVRLQRTLAAVVAPGRAVAAAVAPGPTVVAAAFSEAT